MKNITFWSSVSGRSGTSGNMLAVSTMSTVLYSLRTHLIPFNGEDRMLHQAFQSGRQENILNEEYHFYNRKGLDEMYDKSKIKKLGREEIEDNLVRVRHTNLYYLPGSKKDMEEQKALFDASFVKMLLSGMERMNSLNFMDCIHGRNEIQNRLFQNSDLIVVNLCQGMEGLDELMEEPVIREKAIFIIGRYDENSIENVANIRRKYNIPKECIGVIPYNIHFHDALCKGNLVPFISKGIFHKRGDMDYHFIMELFHTTNMILRKAGYEGI